MINVKPSNARLFPALFMEIGLGRPMADSPDGLVRECEVARRQGQDFPTVWSAILSRHPMVIGQPTHRVVNGEAQIVVKLITGEALVFSRTSYFLG